MEEPDEGQCQGGLRRIAFERWRQHKPLLYDQFYQQRFKSPSNTVDFLPGWLDRGYGGGHQQLVTSGQQDDGTMQLHFVQMPALSDPLKVNASQLEKRITSSITDFEIPILSDILRVRHMPQVPSLLAVKGPECIVLVRSPQAELSILDHSEDKTNNNSNIHSSPVQPVNGDASEFDEDMGDADVAWIVGTLGSGSTTLPAPQENGLAWSPSLIGTLLSTSANGSITVHRIDVDDSPVDATEPFHSETLLTIGQAEVLSGQHEHGANDVAWVPINGPGAPHTFSSVGEDGKLCCWDLRAGLTLVTSCYVHHGAANTMTYSNHDPYTLVTGGADGCLSVLDMRCTSSSNSDGRRAATTSAGQWAPKCHLQTRITSHKCNIEQVSFSPHHRGLLAACDISGRVMLWNIHATKGNGYLKPKQKRFIHYGHLSPVLDLSWSLCEGPPLLATVSEAYQEEQLWQPNVLQR